MSLVISQLNSSILLPSDENKNAELAMQFNKNILENNISDLENILKDGANPNMSIHPDQEMVIFLGTHTNAQEQSEASEILETYFENEAAFFSFSVDLEGLFGEKCVLSKEDLSAPFLSLLNECRTHYLNQKEIPQNLLEDAMRLDLESLDGRFFMSFLTLNLEVSPLALAVECDRFEIAQLLLEAGADPLFRTNLIRDYSISIINFENNDQEKIRFAELFHQHGASIESMVSDYYDGNPIKLLKAAKEAQNEPLVNFLEEHGYHL